MLIIIFTFLGNEVLIFKGKGAPYMQQLRKNIYE